MSKLSQNMRTFEELPHPLSEIAMEEWAAMACNGLTVEELLPPPLLD